MSVKSGVSGLTEQKIEAIVGCQVQKNDGKGLALEKEKKKKRGHWPLLTEGEATWIWLSKISFDQ